MMQETQKTKKAVGIYLVILSLVALANGLSNDVFSNYFKEVYQVSAYQRGIIEFPRELPGILSVMLISALSFLGDIRTSIIAQLLSVVGIIFLGLVTPAFGVMLIFLFLNSFGMHLFMPLSDSIGMSLIGKTGAGRKMGLFKGFGTAFTMLASVIIFIGFRKGLFSFGTQLKPFFLISAGLALIAAVFLIILYKLVGHDMPRPDRKFRFLFRRKYKYYYILAIMYGVQKQIMAVYAPWVLIDLLFKKADTLALLTMAGAFAGIFFIPALGRWIDRFGLKKMLYADALSFIGGLCFLRDSQLRLLYRHVGKDRPAGGPDFYPVHY